jgi:hypothetical protein
MSGDMPSGWFRLGIPAIQEPRSKYISNDRDHRRWLAEVDQPPADHAGSRDDAAYDVSLVDLPRIDRPVGITLSDDGAIRLDAEQSVCHGFAVDTESHNFAHLVVTDADQLSALDRNRWFHRTGVHDIHLVGRYERHIRPATYGD